jgi:hypothetical protein
VNGDGDGDVVDQQQSRVSTMIGPFPLRRLLRQVTSGSEEFDGASVDVELLEAQPATVVSAR